MGAFGDGPGKYNEFNEVAPLRIRPTRWLAAVRTLRSDVQLIVSGDDGKTWKIPENLSNGGLTKLSERPVL